MPNKNGTGPEGKGAQTGRGLGNCSQQELLSEDKPRRRGLANRSWLGKGNKRRKSGNRN